MEIPMAPRVERRARRMHEMMKRTGADPVLVARLRDGEAYSEARARCMNCGTTDKCLRWLDQSKSNRRPEFCPNLSMFEDCARQVSNC